MRRLIVFLTLLLLSGGATVSAQSLAELAKKEKERRKANAVEAKSFDESDLRTRGAYLPQPVTSSTEEGESTTAESEEPEEEEEDEVDPTQTEAYWRNRIAPIDRRIADIQSQLNAPGFAEDPTNLSRRQRLERDLSRARADRQAVLDEARRKGVPPGWLR
jgi:hypothetical protein